MYGEGMQYGHTASRETGAARAAVESAKATRIETRVNRMVVKLGIEVIC